MLAVLDKLCYAFSMQNFSHGHFTGVMEYIQKLWHPMGILCSATGVQQGDSLVLHQLTLKIAGDHLTKD